MIFGWFRRRQPVRVEPFPATWTGYLQRYVPHFDALTFDEQSRLTSDVRDFVARKYWEGCRGLNVTDEMRVAIAGQACLLTLELGNLYDRLLSILIYPREYVAPSHTPVSGELAIHGEQERLGEASQAGVVVLDWSTVRDGPWNEEDPQNLVLHEFAHVIDMRLGASTGTPPLADRALRRRWEESFVGQYQRHVRDVERGRDTLLDPYGAENRMEFFAVASECFFEWPRELQSENPELYALLQAVYRQDPAARMKRHGAQGEE